MRRMLAGLLLLAICSPALGDGEVNVEQLNRMYDQAVAQLRAAQDRRNELSKENEKLSAQIRDLQKQVQEAKGETRTIANRNATFQDFLKRYPGVDVRWRLFMRNDLLGGTECVLDQLNSQWPFTEPK
jgi:peptidoglycan hydrolase CwlO-like protein